PFNVIRFASPPRYPAFSQRCRSCPPIAKWKETERKHDQRLTAELLPKHSSCLCRWIACNRCRCQKHHFPFITKNQNQYALCDKQEKTQKLARKQARTRAKTRATFYHTETHNSN
ncbi:unnamed protein product, partial [Ectocarpus sp. 12 AP-2014]